MAACVPVTRRSLRGLGARLLAALLATGLLTGAVAESARAELRTGAAKALDPHGKGKPTLPELESARVAYDSEAGLIVFTVKLTDELADWTQTSALRGWRVSLDLGGVYYRRTCVSTVSIKGALVPNGAAPLRLGRGATGEEGPQLPVLRIVGEDLDEVTFIVSDPSLRNLNLICMNATLIGPQRSPNADRRTSSTFGRLLEGFDPYDGDVLEDAVDDLRTQVWRAEEALRGRSLKRPPAAPDCRRVAADEARCAVKAVLRVPGKPTLSVKPTGQFVPFGPIGPERWHWRGTWTLRYEKCPKDLRGPRTSSGACTVKRSWRGGLGSLADSLQETLRSLRREERRR